MKIAIWDEPCCAFIKETLEEAGFQVEAKSRYHCAEALKNKEVDIALLSAYTYLKSSETFQLLPHVALIVQKFPWAQLLLRTPLDKIRNVGIDPSYTQEILMTSIVLKEHYGTIASFKPYENPSLEDLFEQADTALACYMDTRNFDGIKLDLGIEWYEFVGGSMPWGVFGVTRGREEEESFKVLIELFRQDSVFETWYSQKLFDEATQHFFEQGFDMQFDSEAFQGLDAFAKNLFYYGALDEIPEIKFLALKEDNKEAL